MVPPEMMMNNGATTAIVAPQKGHFVLARSRAYVTFLAGNGDYVKGVVGLAKGLKKVNTAYPLVVAVLPDVPQDHRQLLESHGCIVREIHPENQTQFAMAYYVLNYSKLLILLKASHLGGTPGMFVFEPSLSIYDQLLKTLQVTITTPTSFAEQDFLFKNIYKLIPLVYNLVLAMLWRHPENVELHKVKQKWKY